MAGSVFIRGCTIGVVCLSGCSAQVQRWHRIGLLEIVALSSTIVAVLPEELDGGTADENETYGGMLMTYWDAYGNNLVIEPCEAWVDDAHGQLKWTRTELVSKAKTEMCNKNAWSGALTGATPIPGVDIVAGLLASFYIQARAACIVAKIRGYDVRDEKTHLMMFYALLGESGTEFTRHISKKLARSGGAMAGGKVFQNVPKHMFKDVNKKMWPLLGRHLITKGPQGILSLGKFVPVVGSMLGFVVGAGADWLFCHWTVDYADKNVFEMRHKGQAELRAFLLSVDFDEEASSLVDTAEFDISSVCDAGQSVFMELMAYGRALKLHRALRSHDGPCRRNDRVLDQYGSPRELREYLKANSFDEEIPAIIDNGKLDATSICGTDRKALMALGIPMGRAMKLHNMLRTKNSLCLTSTDEFRHYLQKNHFEEEITPLIVEAKFDKSSICDAEKSDIMGLGIPMGRALKLYSSLRSKGGLCSSSLKPDDEL